MGWRKPYVRGSSKILPYGWTTVVHSGGIVRLWEQQATSLRMDYSGTFGWKSYVCGRIKILPYGFGGIYSGEVRRAEGNSANRYSVGE